MSTRLPRTGNQLLDETNKRFIELAVKDDREVSLEEKRGVLTLLHNSTQQVVLEPVGDSVSVREAYTSRGNCSAVAIVDAAIASGSKSVMALLDDLESSVHETVNYLSEEGDDVSVSEIAESRLASYRDIRERLGRGVMTADDARILKVDLHQRLLSYNGGDYENLRSFLGIFNSEAKDIVFPGTMEDYLNKSNSKLGELLSEAGQKILLTRIDFVDPTQESPSPSAGISNHYSAIIRVGDEQYITGVGNAIFRIDENQPWADAARRAGRPMEIRREIQLPETD